MLYMNQLFEVMDMKRSGKIFVVEDSLLDVQVIKDALLQRGYRVVGVANSVEEAMPMIMKRKPDLVLMDITLKGEKDGIWAASQVQNHLGIPVLFLSGLLNEDLMERILLAEPHGFLIKPFNEKELYINIELALYKAEMKKSLDRSEHRFQSMIQVLPDILFCYDNEGTHLEIFTSDDQLLVKDAQWLKGRKVTEALPDPLGKQMVSVVQKALATNTLQTLEYELTIAKGPRIFEMRVMASGENEAVAIVRDVTERKKAEEEMIYLRFRDRLTGLYNRDFFEEELRRLDTERQYPLSVIMGDIDGLKLINDVLGHQQGDCVAVTIADILRESCRDEDIVCRTGGDEFTILLPQIDEADVRKIMRRIKRKCEEQMEKGALTSLSLGAGTKHDQGKLAAQLIKDADDNMYRNKQTNRDQRLKELLERMKAHPEYNEIENLKYKNRLDRYGDSLAE